MLKKQALLFLLSCLLMGLFFLLPRNNVWLKTRPLTYLKEFVQQKNNLDWEYRKRTRWGNAYTLSKQIAGLLGPERERANLLVLIPPRDYFKDRNIDYPVPEPAVFYYYTGIKTIWANSKEASKANRVVRAVNGRLLVDVVTNDYALADSLRTFRKYKTIL
jgi:hypothetical protein